MHGCCAQDGARCSWLCGAGTAAEKVESRVRHFAGVAVSPYKMAASTSTLQRCSRRLDLVPRWAGQRLFLRPTTSSSTVSLLRLERSSHAPTPSLIDEC